MLGVPIHEQVALVAQEAIERVGEIAADLHHPGLGGMAGAAGQLHTTGGELQHKQEIKGNEPSFGPDLDGGEIDRGQNIPRLQNRLHISLDIVRKVEESGIRGGLSTAGKSD